MERECAKLDGDKVKATKVDSLSRLPKRIAWNIINTNSIHNPVTRAIGNSRELKQIVLLWLTMLEA